MSCTAGTKPRKAGSPKKMRSSRSLSTKSSQGISVARLQRAGSMSSVTSEIEKPPITVTSASHPLKVSWLADEESDNPDCVLHRIAMSSCPGKNLKLGRDGIIYERSLPSDIEYLSKCGISMIVCLLSQSELSCLGISLKQYTQLCSKKGRVEFVHFPVVEMAPFDSMDKLYQLCERISVHLVSSDRHHCLIHCRGGMGRTGTLAACMVLFPRTPGMSPKKAIAHVRAFRSQRAIESRKQEDCVRDFAHHLSSPDASTVSETPVQDGVCEKVVAQCL